MTRVPVNPEILRWAMVRAKQNEETLSKKFPKIKHWLDGIEQPTLKQLERFARVTHVPFGALFLSRPPEESLSIPFFRTVRYEIPEKPSAELLDTIESMKFRQSWMRAYLQRIDAPPLDFVGSHSVEDDTEIIVRDMRRVLRMDEQWVKGIYTWEAALRQLRNRMEEVGILVVVNSVVGNNTHRKLSVHEFRGFVLVDPYAPLVFVNGGDSKAAQMFTLVHELAHVFLGEEAIFDLSNMMPASSKLEVKCNEVAAEFLVPRNYLEMNWDKHSEIIFEVERLARLFKVSELVIARRALDLRFISKEDFFRFYDRYQRRIREIQDQSKEQEGGGDFYTTTNLRIGRRFAQAVMDALRNGDVLYTDAYQLTGLYGGTFDKYVEWLASGQH
ncbi:ImmA/IrrE family metallo-endopeptidase [Alicyclobacillus sendaiensis]|uniref:ImmA/IrrE family metallo-endopeptidase n=1 Tax=Alicyclobacillus sendaiensis PA2 TaxID=3029425 RepID=A0ABT6Y1Z2_ALISE|nr:ImmA/IrrE family metallo-endopeptidase [Alicyclobacillus sendaiensis]MDI9261327.1 ImmA/IrrE family metallo-endopeptidase [Alicyclobacillus sendaiensis PA2]